MLSAIERFERISRLYPGNEALEVEGISYKYDSLLKLSLQINRLLQSYPEEEYVGILSYRTLSTYAGILGTLASGKCYVPFSPKLPSDRIRKIIRSAGCRIFIADREFIPLIPEFLAGSVTNAVIITPEEISFGIEDLPDLTIFDKNIISEQEIMPVNSTGSSNPAYLLFTSGSTGEPKGIPINNSNLSTYIEYISKVFPLFPQDRCTQLFDTTFDLSVHDMFVTWNAGAKLIVIPKKILMAPVKYLADRKITVWFSVPSLVSFLVRMNILRENILPDLRLSFFCGESLPVEIVKAWRKAAPDSRIINLYGPTETTISISWYEWSDSFSENESFNNIVPLGKVFGNHNIAILDKFNEAVKNGEPGELSISGPQVANGYFKDESKTSLSFIKLENSGNRTYYKTGDLVRINPGGNLIFLGRKDNQVQIRGYRVELGEIEASIRQFTKCAVVAVGWPANGLLADGVIVFVESEAEIDGLQAYCSKVFPEYMVPSKTIWVKHFPLNINGKIDRNELIKPIR
jgi:amino acid adenylation domain-containing protein